MLLIWVWVVRAGDSASNVTVIEGWSGGGGTAGVELGDGMSDCISIS